MTPARPRRAVICFTRVPRPGRAKTRLAPLLGGENCAGLQWAFLRDLAGVYDMVSAELFVAYAPDEGWEELRGVFPSAAGFFPQEGEGLGPRMYGAICAVLARGYRACVLTGSDLPLMTAAHLESGFKALEGADAALGPTPDGGYYLVGMKRPCPELFDIGAYGGPGVYERTVAAAKAAGYTVLPALPCGDVDTPEDLRSLWANPAGAGPHTARFLKKMTEAGVLL